MNAMSRDDDADSESVMDADDQEESIEDLLSGPKDSVTMFSGMSSGNGGRWSNKFQLDMSTGGDPLDVLAQEVQARRGSPTTESVVECFTAQPAQPARCPEPEPDMSHQRELAIRCRGDLHKGLDLFLNGAAQHQRVAELEQELEHTKLRASQERAKCLAESMHKSDEIVYLKRMVASYEEEKQLLQDAQRDFEVDMDGARSVIQSLKQQLASISQASESLLDARRSLETHQRLLETTQQDALQLRGDRDALRFLSVGQLTSLSDTLTLSLQQVQLATSRQYERLKDEKLCVACLSEPKTVVLQPCNHLTMCANCFAQCKETCPQCRADVKGHLVIYA